MKKRQRKKNEKLHVRLYPDEANLLFMTSEERELAVNDFMQFRQKLARRRYRELKNLRMMYVYPNGTSGKQFINSMASQGNVNLNLIQAAATTIIII
ncbi:hypothetical protein [Bacillus sp. FJAT-28004]|uniref:hypothetical protein n=1 Tax=Bacillus sp. FJAT-28004 TaxID=1679165 RepID=UPI0006B494D0|nr:hypothetical protein [Bacillus sp. FJAT-28004]